MSNKDNAARGNGRRPIDFATCSPQDCTSGDVCRAFVIGDAGAARRLAYQLVRLPAEQWRDVLELAISVGKRGDA